MLTLQPLPIPRQRNVGHALGEVFKHKNKHPAEVVRHAKAVVEATAALKDPEGPSMFVIDTATDGVITAMYRLLGAVEKGFVDTVVPLGAAQKARLEAAELLSDAWFPEGIEFIRDSVGLQNSVMVKMRRALDGARGPELRAAIDTLGLGPMVEHLVRHMDVYAKKLGLVGLGDAEPTMSEASKAWHKAYTLFAASVMSAYADDPEAQSALLGSYQKQLDEHRDDVAKARKRAKKAQAEAKKKADAEAQQALEAEAKKAAAEAAKRAPGEG